MARRRFVVGVAVAILVALAVLALLVDDGVLGVLALVGAAFVVNRRPIIAAKHAEGW